jgi:capsular polysaccharide biosynthesis protein/Mrp family chromosome partitioning ATPase
MNETPRYATLRDYLRVIRKHRALIAAVTVAFALAGLLLSLTQTKQYTAQTSLTFRDIEQDLTLLGDEGIPELAPDQRAAVNAELVTRPNVATRVKEALGTGTDLSPDELRSAISTQIGARTNFVILQATTDDPEFAAELANAYATEVQETDREEVRKRIDAAIASLRGASSPAANPTRQTQISQLETVRELARPVEIAKEAEVPSSPSSPRTLRNTILGGLVGLVIGLVLAFLRDSLDRRLRASDDVQDEFQLPVIGRVPDTALGEIGFVGNGRPGEEAEAHLEAFRVLRTNLEFLQAGEPLRSVLVTSGLAEEGKSTVAIALAGAAAMSGKRTLLVECDLRRPCFADRLDLDPQPGLTDYLVGRASPADILQVVELSPTLSENGDLSSSTRSKKGSKKQKQEPLGAMMVCITAGSNSPLPAELLGSERFSNFLEKVSKAYEMVVIDSSPILSVVDAMELVSHVDGMVVCVRL